MAAMSDRLSGAMAFKALQPLGGHEFADLVMTRAARRLSLPLSTASITAHWRGHLYVTSYTEGFSHLVTPIDCSGCFRLERLPSGPCTHWKAPPYSRRTRSADVADSALAAGGKRSTALNAIERLPHAAQS